MPSWYPHQARAEFLRAQLTKLEGLASELASDPSSFIPTISHELVKAQRRSDFPTHQMRRWIWLASQYRLNVGASAKVVGKAAAALQFLSEQLRKDRIVESDIQDLNWVLDSTIRSLSQFIPAGDLRACLGPDELARIDERFSTKDGLEEFDSASMKTAVARQMSVLRSFGEVPDFANLEQKVEALFAAAAGNSPERNPARAALRYLADQDDVVSDQVGLLGLVDDVYVIEWAYAAVESYTRCLPLLEALLRKWPYVADMPFIENESACLGRYEQYVVCAGLHTLFGDDEAGLSVVREVGPFAVMTTVLAAIECARCGRENSENSPASWSCGDSVVIGDATQTFKATYQGIMPLGSNVRYRLGVRDRGIITVDESVLPYISRASKPHARLSSGNEISVWLRDRHVDPFTHLTGAARVKPERQACALLVGPKHKLDKFIECLNVLGARPQALLGLRYVDAQGRISDYSGSTSDRPLIYATHDVSSALDLIRDPPDHVCNWKIVADGARLGRALFAGISTAGELSRKSICVFAELSEREATADLIEQGLERVWYLEDQDVQAPSTVLRRPPERADPVSRFVTRISNHWSTTLMRHDVHDTFLESVAACLSDRIRDNSGGFEFAMLNYSASAFVREATANPLVVRHSYVRSLAEAVAAQASTMRQYQDRAQRLYELFREFLKSGTELKNREAQIETIVRDLTGGEKVAVVCRSSQIAQSCMATALEIPGLSHLKWLNLESLRSEAPFDRIIVPGWLDRLSMRELACNGYGAKLELLLLPFEMRWFDSTNAALRRWERNLERRSTVHLRRVTNELVGNSTSRRWRRQSDLRLLEKTMVEPREVELTEEGPDTELVEARAIEALSRAVAQSDIRRSTTKAQLVLFETPGAYAFLPPAGRVIVLSGLQTAEPVSTDGDAERLLFRNVADLDSGMVLAVCVDSDRDLVDARADQFLSEAVDVRKLAGLWKSALKRHLRDDEGIRAFALSLKNRGESRCQATLRAWISETQTIAPRNYRRVIPLLAELSGDEELKRRTGEVIQAVDLIYRARSRAAEAIVRELFAGTIDLDAPELRFDLGGREISYALHKVRRVADVLEVPIELVGKIGNLADLPKTVSV